MSLNIRRQNARRPPMVIAGIVPSLDEHARQLRKVQDDLRQDLSTTADAIGFDVHDELKIVSQGAGAEVAQHHDLGFLPERWHEVDKTGDGSIWRSKDHAWTANTVYFVTSADEGVEFTVVFGKKAK